MALFKSLGKHIPDFDSSVLLANRTTAVAVTTTETGISLNNANQAYWEVSDVTAGTLVVALAVLTAARTSTETYTFSLQVGNESFSSPVTVATTQALIAAGSTRLIVDAEALLTVAAASRTHMRLVCTVAGSGAPSTTYIAWLTDGREI